MHKFTALIFDLDGTLVDSLHDIADAMNRTLIRFGYPVYNYNDYRYFVGGGLRNLVIRCLPQADRTDRRVDELLGVMMDEYGQNYVKKTALYPGIPELLDLLTEKGYKMSILSNKADELTQKIVSSLLDRWKFDEVMGNSERFPRKPAPESALYIAKTMDVDPQAVLYLGDTDIDMQTAHAAGMYPVGVTWGFRSEEELIANGAERIIHHPADLFPLL